MDGTNLMRLAELLKIAGKPSHGYTISETGPEVVTAPGVYFPSKPGEVIPLQSRVEGGSVSPTSSSSDTEKEKLAILRDIISVIKPRQDHGGQGLESRQMGGSVSPDGKPSLMDEIEKSKYDIFKAAMSVLKPQKQSLNERTSAYGSPSGKSQFSPSLPTTLSLPGLPKPITSSSYGMMPDAFKPSEGEALWQKKRAELGWENPGEDLWTHKRREAGVLDLTSRQYGGFVSPDEEELKARKKWEIPSYPERRLEEVRNILGPSVLGVQPGFQKSYYEEHPEEKLMDEETARMKPLTDAIMKSIEDARTKEQGYGLGFGPTPAERRLGAGRGREQPSEIPGLVTAGALLAPKLTKGILPTGITTPKQPTLSPVGQLIAERDTLPPGDPRRESYNAAIKKATEQVEKTPSELGLIAQAREIGPDGKPTPRAIEAKGILEDEQIRKEGGIPPMSPEIANIPSVKGVKNELALEGLSEQDKSTIRGLSNYQYPWPGAFALSKPVWAARMARLQKYYPDFSAAEYQTRFNIRKSFTSGKEKDNILALNTATGHINSLVNASNDLANSNWVTGNAALNLLAKYFPVSEELVKRQGKVTSVKTKFNAVADEMAGIFKRTGATDTAIKAWRDTIQSPETATPEMWKGFIGGGLELMGSRIEALRDIYEAGMGKWKDFPILSNSSRKILSGLGVDVDRIDRVAGEEVPTGEKYTQEDLEFTANKHGITVEEVRRRLRGGK